jgi:hypothetical protein
VRRLTGAKAASLAAVVVAGLIAAFFEPFPPLMAVVHSKAWTLLIEWFMLSASGMALLAWAGVTDMEFELSSSGIKARRIEADSEAVDQLRKELSEMQEDFKQLLQLTRVLLEQQSLHHRGGGPRIDEGDDV